MQQSFTVFKISQKLITLDCTRYDYKPSYQQINGIVYHLSHEQCDFTICLMFP